MGSSCLLRVSTTAVLLFAVAGCGGDGSSAPDHLDPGSTHALFDNSGRFAYPAPRLAEGISVEPEDDGSATVRFAVAYALANRTTSDGVAADRAEITLRVAPELYPSGPRPDGDVFTRQWSDEELADGDGVRHYEVTLPAEVVDFLNAKGFGSGDADLRVAAQRLLVVRIQQGRDFQLVDGRLDWFHGTTFDAAQSPTAPADNPGGALTIRNDTGSGIYDINFAGLEPVAQQFGQGLFPGLHQYSLATTDSPGVSIAVAGQEISCFYQGKDGSNPAGFNQNLAPGDAVTQTIVADDSHYDLPNNATQATTAANAIEYTIKAGVALLNVTASILFGGPFTLIVAMATNLINVSEYCDNQPNLFQIGIVAESGQATNATTWSAWDACNGSCGGFANYYSSPLRSSAPTIDATVVNNAVQLAPDSDNTYEGHPLWLAQVPIQGCGVGNASDSNTSGCTSQNLISVRWTTSAPCPWTNGYQEYNGSVVGDESWCHQSAPTSPEVPACGTNNQDCVSYSP